jgi:hypothetical protein
MKTATILSIIVLFFAGCVSDKQVTAATREAHIAHVKANVALMLLSKPTREEFEVAVKSLGGTLAGALKAGDLVADIPLLDIREGARGLLVTYRVDESGRVITISVEDIILTKCY